MSDHSLRFPSIPTSPSKARSRPHPKRKPSHHHRHSLNDIRDEEMVVSHFLIKYLERKEVYDSKTMNDGSLHFPVSKGERKISVKFRREHRKQLKGRSQIPKSRFMIGVQ